MNSSSTPLGGKVRIACSREGQQEVQVIQSLDFFIGRPADPSQPYLNLAEDDYVSRKHARVWFEDGFFWIEDLGSKLGTMVDGEEIKDKGKRRITAKTFIQVGKTVIQLLEEINPQVPEHPMPAKESGQGEQLKIDTSLDIHCPAFDPDETPVGDVYRHQAALMELPLELGGITKLGDLLQTIMRRAIESLPNARRGAVLLCGPDDKLLLAAFVSPTEPAVSLTLAKQALAEEKGLIWKKGSAGSLAESMRRLGMASGLYVPMIWMGRRLGVLCFDNPDWDEAFSEHDLRLALGIAQYAAMAVANQRLQEELRHNAVVTERMLTSFSPGLRKTLLEKARHGRLWPGGQKSEVTILFSDIRGFTRTSENMEADEVMSLLNEYMPALAEVIFQNNGTIDKFIGDAILAVFGSPEKDPDQHLNAIKAALAIQAEVAQISARRTARKQPVCGVGVGIHSGVVLHGFIGNDSFMEFTVIGDAVNKASRYCSGAQAGDILISPEVFQHVYKQVTIEPRKVVTKHEGELLAYWLRGLKPMVS